MALSPRIDLNTLLANTLRWLAVLLLLFSLVPASHAAEQPAPLRIGLSPVFLDDQASFLERFRGYLQRHMQRPVIFVQRGSYRELVDLLRENKLDFAWQCGYPYIANSQTFRLVAVSLYRGKPQYQSYLIVPSDDQTTRSLLDLRGKVFAFSDPDSMSGHLYPEYLLAREGVRSTIFAKSIYAWGHRHVVEAVAAGLAQGGAVDGYVWDTLARNHPELTAQTRIVSRSPLFGRAPIVAATHVPDRTVAELQEVLFAMARNPEGLALLNELNLDGFAPGDSHLYDDIAMMSRFVKNQHNVAPERY